MRCLWIVLTWNLVNRMPRSTRSLRLVHVLANCRKLLMLRSRPRFHEARNSLSSREFAMLEQYGTEKMAGTWLNLALSAHTYSLESRIKLLRGCSIFLYEEVCLVVFVGIKKGEKVINQPFFCSRIFHAICVIVQIFRLQCVLFCFRSCTLFISSTICWYWSFSQINFFQTVGFALALRQYTSIITRGRMPTFLPHHMIVLESGVTARHLILPHITSARIYPLKVKTLSHLLAIVWTPHPRNIKLLAAVISKTGYILVQCKSCVNLGGFFGREFYSCHNFPGR